MPQQKIPKEIQSTFDDLRGAIIALAAFSAFINLLMLTAPLYMLQVFDRVLTSQSYDTLIVLSLMALVALVALGALDGSRSIALNQIGKWLDARLNQSIFKSSIAERLIKRGPSSAQGLRDLAAIRSFIGGQALVPIMDAPWFPLFIGVIFLLHPMLGFMALGGAVVLLILAVLNEFSTRGLLQRGNAAQIVAMNHAEAAVRNADVIDAMGMFGATTRRWLDHQQKADTLQTKANNRGSIISGTSKFIRMLLQSAMLGAGAWLVIRQELSPGGMVAGTILLGRALAPVDQALGSWKACVAARGAYQRIRERFEAYVAEPEAMELPRPNGSLTCQGVTYRHGDGEPTVNNISFELPAGNVLGIVGPSAAGKTTLARLMVGNLKPRLGHVRLDGMDIAEWISSDRGKYIGYLPQDIELFSGTVRENIARLEQGGADEVIEAAELAGVHDMILRLPKGYETEIGDGGAALSAGQRQRIGLARALYGNPSLIVLDEPNSNLDHAGLDALIQLFSVLKSRGATVVVVAHQPNVIRHVDALLVLNAGSIQMMGPTDAVLSKIAGPIVAPGSMQSAAAANVEPISKNANRLAGQSNGIS